jgi:hypothetical protein
MGFDSYITSPQQLYNTSSHGGGPHTLGPTHMWGDVVQLLWWCCKSIIFLKKSWEKYMVLKICVFHMLRDICITLLEWFVANCYKLIYSWFLFMYYVKKEKRLKRKKGWKEQNKIKLELQNLGRRWM